MSVAKRTRQAALVNGYAPSHRFEKDGTVASLKQIVDAGWTEHDVKALMRLSVTGVILKAGETTFQLTHGGIASPFSIHTSAYEAYIGSADRERLCRGLGDYSVNDIRRLEVEGVISIHGHRNGVPGESPLHTKVSDTHYVVEHRVEYDGFLPYVVIEPDGTVSDYR